MEGCVGEEEVAGEGFGICGYGSVVSRVNKKRSEGKYRRLVSRAGKRAWMGEEGARVG